jgi:hypothetical protein
MATSLNNTLLSRVNHSVIKTRNDVIKRLKSEFHQIDNDTLYAIYKKSISIRQSNLVKNGSVLEYSIERFLTEHNIGHKSQVTIDKNGVIVGFGTKQKCHHIIDFVVGQNILINDNIDQHIVLSCKTTCRERWTQDNWTLSHTPTLYCLLTMSCDYPNSYRFQESEKRKIITCKEKKKDDRMYKLNYDSLLSEINNNIYSSNDDNT